MDAETTALTAQRLVLPQEGIAVQAESLYLRGDGEITGRRTYRVPTAGTASFATYFNAFPVGIWRSVAGIDRVTLRLRSDGVGTHRIFGVAPDGPRVHIAESRGTGELVLETGALPEAINWLWLETTAEEQSVTVSEAEWLVAAPARPVRIMVSITTMNRVEDCALLLRSLGDDELSDVISRVLVVDQGSDPIAPHAPGVVLDNSVPLRLIAQENLGGSGGFSRGMLESLDTEATHVLLLDDDVRIEPESLRRLHALASVAKDVPLLGAQMLSMIDPTVLHSMGEQIDHRRMWWHSVAPELSSADLAGLPLERTPALQRFQKVDFNGWWMCLIPVHVIRRIGASMPYFIKWDDAEYGLRAARAGHRTVTVPGVALWHVPWTSKDDGLDWQAYYQLRNRVVTALVYERRPGRVLSATWMQDVNHALCLQYGAIRLRNLALKDVLSGPSHLPTTLRGGRARAQAVLAAAGQVVHEDAGEAVTVSMDRPESGAASARRLLQVLIHQLAPVRAGGDVASIAREQGKWWHLGLVDEGFLRSASGTGHFRLRRSRREFFSLLTSSAWLRIRLRFAWGRTARSYRDESERISSPAMWGRVYAEAGASEA